MQKQQKQLSFTFNKRTNLSTIQDVEFNIIQEYNKLALGNSSTQLSLIECKQLDQLPKHFPERIKKQYNQCIALGLCSLYDMFTILIFEYLLKDITLNKQGTLTDLKWLIYDEQFMCGNYYTKGLIIKGFKLLERQLKIKYQKNQILAQCLIKQDLCKVFAQCWKQIVSKTCYDYSMELVRQQNQLDVLDILGSYFMIDFTVLFKSGNQMQSISKIKQFSPIAIIIDEDSEILSNNNNYWKYYILIKSGTSNFKHSVSYIPTSLQGSNLPISKMESQISRIQDMDCSYNETEDLKIFLDQKALQNTTTKKQSLLKSPYQFNLLSIVNNIRCSIQQGQLLINQLKLYIQEQGI